MKELGLAQPLPFPAYHAVKYNKKPDVDFTVWVHLLSFCSPADEDEPDSHFSFCV